MDFAKTIRVITIVLYFTGYSLIAQEKDGGIKPQFDSIRNFSEGLAAARVHGAWGFIDRSGSFVIKPEFYIAYSFVDGLAMVMEKSVDGTWGFIDKTGRMVITRKSGDVVSNFSEGRAAVKTNGRWGFIDKSGSFVIEPAFDWVSSFDNGSALVKVDLTSWHIDTNGRRIERKETEDKKERHFCDGLALVKIDGKYGFMDRSGKLVAPPKFDNADDFSGGRALVRINGKFGFIDTSGNFVVKPKFYWVGEFNENRALVILTHCDKYDIQRAPFSSLPAGYDSDYSDISQDMKGYVDQSGTLIIKPRFEDAKNFYEGRALVKTDGKWGFIDTSGTFIVKPIFEAIGDFSEGLAPVKINETWGFIDKTGRVVITPKFDYARSFKNGLAPIRINGKWGFIDKSGNF